MARRRSACVGALLALCVALAGCGQAGKAGADGGQAAAQGVLHGVVVDAAIRPVAGAELSIAGRNETAVTGDDGAYAFPGTLPREAPLLVLVHANGFEAASRQTSLPPDGDTQLDIQLVAVPAATGYREVLHFTGLIGCQGAVAVGEDEPQRADCGGDAAPSHAAWDIPLGPGLVTAVVELVWDPGTSLADGLGADLTHPDRPDALLAQNVGRSPLRLVLAQQTVGKEFPAGGDVRLTVRATPITDEDEQAVAAALDVNQGFEAYASLFYGTAPDPSYSFVDGDGA